MITNDDELVTSDRNAVKRRMAANSNVNCGFDDDDVVEEFEGVGMKYDDPKDDDDMNDEEKEMMRCQLSHYKMKKTIQKYDSQKSEKLQSNLGEFDDEFETMVEMHHPRGKIDIGGTRVSKVKGGCVGKSGLFGLANSKTI